MTPVAPIILDGAMGVKRMTRPQSDLQLALVSHMLKPQIPGGIPQKTRGLGPEARGPGPSEARGRSRDRPFGNEGTQRYRRTPKPSTTSLVDTKDKPCDSGQSQR